MMDRYNFLSSIFLSLILVVFVSPEAVAQTGSISGTVTDASTGGPLPGANVVIAGTNLGTATNTEGNYTIDEIEPGTYTVRVSFVGYENGVEEGVQVQAGETTTVNFQLTPVEAALEEVVVVGYGERRQERVTGSVSQISASDVEDVSAPSASQVLQGQATGLMVHRTGVPGTAPEVRIRGLNTLNSNDPLYIVDGVERDNLMGLNTSNIESVEILKDASAAAIYGSRASGGVVLISTKGGRAGELQVNVSSSVGLKNPHQRLDLLNTQQYVEVNTDLRRNAGSPPPARFDQEGFPENFLKDGRWQEAYFQNTVFSNNNIAVSGGTQNAKARVSLGYLTEGGSIVETGYERYSFRVNSTFTFGRLQLSESFSLSQGIDNLRRGDGLEGIIQMPPYIPVYNEDHLGGFGGVDQVDGADKPNPIREEVWGFARQNDTQITGNITAEMQIIESLTLRSVFGVDTRWTTTRRATPPFFEGDFHSQNYTAISETRTQLFQPVSTTTLNLNQFVVGNHEFNSTLGFEIQNTTVRTRSLNGRNNLTDQTDIATVPLPGFEASVGEDVLISTFGRVSYSFAGRYQIEGSLRRDGYSRFGIGNKYGLFPSASVGWNVTEEPFMENVSALSTLRLRGSWGFTGNNEALNRYEYQSTFNVGGQYNFGDEVVTAAAIPQLANASLAWEKTESINVGVDLGVLDDALTITAEYFQNTTEDILLNVPLPPSFGYSGDTRANTGTVVSNGFELQATYESRSTGNFHWSVDANFSHSSNEVESLGLGNPINTKSWGWGGSTASKRLEEGQPIFYWYGWKVDRLFQKDDFNANGELKQGIPDQSLAAPGDIKFKDLNGDGVINTKDQTNLGDPQPDYTFGMTGQASWGSFDLTVFLQGVAGFQIAPAYQGFSRGMTRVWNHETAVLDRWTPQNTDTNVPRAIDGDPNNNSRISDRFVQDGDYVRLKRVTIGYTPAFLGQRFDWVRNARIYIRGEDLLTLTGYEGLDPEVVNDGGDLTGFGYDDDPLPRPRRFSVGVQLGF